MPCKAVPIRPAYVRDSVVEPAIGRDLLQLHPVGARLLEAGWDVFYWRHRDWEVDFVALGPKASGGQSRSRAARCRRRT